MSLKPPTPRQEEFLRAWANDEDSDVQIWLRRIDRGYNVWNPETAEGDVARYLNATNQAGIAILSGLVRNGWLRSEGPAGGVIWQLTDEGLENITFFVDVVDS